MINHVNDFLGASVEQASRAVLSSRSDPLRIGTNVLGVLGGYKSELEKEVAQLSAKRSELLAALAERLPSDPDLNVRYSAIISNWLRDLLLDECVLPNLSELENQFLQAASDPSFDFDRPGPVRRSNPCCFGAETTGMRVVSGCCKHCGWASGLLEERKPLGWLLGLWCPVCGAASIDARFQAYFLSAVAEPLVFLAQFVLAEALLRSEDLLRLILAAVSVLLSRLRAAVFPHEIATSQRSFFIHHGAHPPRFQPSRAPGLLSGMAFQPHVAA